MVVTTMRDCVGGSDNDYGGGGDDNDGLCWW